MSITTAVPTDVEMQAGHSGRILNVVVDGRTGKTWIQRSMRVEEVEMMAEEFGRAPIFWQDFFNTEPLDYDAVLEIDRDETGRLTGRMRGPG